MAKKQSDGRYRAKITIGTGVDGKPIHKYVSGCTQRELEEAKVAARKHYVDGAMYRQDVLFDEYVHAWYKAKKEPILSDSSREGYSIYINSHIIPVFGGRMMRAIQAMEIQTWLNGYTGKSKTAITMLMTIMQAVFQSAYAEGILQRDPTIGLIKPKPIDVKDRRSFTKEECVQIEATIKTHKQGKLLAILYYLGLRRGEALGLQWGDFDWKKRTVTIQRDVDYAGSSVGKIGDLKTKAAYRTIPIPDPLYDYLKNVRGLPNVYLFGSENNTPMSRTTFQRYWMLLMIDAGFAEQVEEKEQKKEKIRPDVRFQWKTEITPHFFRHHYATMLYNAGVDPLVAMRLLGHSNYATTAKIYTHLNNMHISNAANQINEELLNKKVAVKLPAQEDS